MGEAGLGMCPKELQHFRVTQLHPVLSSQWGGLTWKMGPGCLGGINESAAISAR